MSIEEKLVSADEARAMLDGTTPGPWTLWAEHATVFAGDITENTPGSIAGGDEVCDVDPMRSNERDPDPRDEDAPCGCGMHHCEECYPVCFADARLIASAPDLARTMIAQAEFINTLVAIVRAADLRLLCEGPGDGVRGDAGIVALLPALLAGGLAAAKTAHEMEEAAREYLDADDAWRDARDNNRTETPSLMAAEAARAVMAGLVSR